MAKKQVQSTELPTIPNPADMEAQRQQKLQSMIGFDDVLKWYALGLAPTSPRIPEQATHYGSMFGAYPKGFTNKTGAKGTINFYSLREVFRRSPLLSAIISRRKHQGVRHARTASKTQRGDVGFRVTHRHSGERGFKIPEGFKALMRESEQMILRPWRVFWDDGIVFQDVEPNMAGFMSKVIEDLLVINRPCIELGLDALNTPRAFGAIDGANVVPTFSALKYLATINKDMPRDFMNNWSNYRRNLQMMSDKYKVDLDERTEYIYLTNGRPTAGFRHNELIVAPQFPTTDVKYVGYPPSMVEASIHIILAEILAMKGNSVFFEYGQMAEVIIAAKGNQKDQHITNLVDILKSNMSGVMGMHRVPVIATPGGKEDIDVIPLKKNANDMLFDIYIQKLTNLACAVFSMHPSEINEAPRAGDNSGSLNQASQSKQINMAQEQGLEAMLEHIKTSIFDPILERIDPDLCLEWEYGESEAEKLDLVTKYGTISTVNERRTMMGLDPISEEDGGNVIDNQFIQQQKQQEQQAEQASQAEGSTQPGGSPEVSGSKGKSKAGKNDKQKRAEEEVDYESETPEERIERLVRRNSSKTQR